MDLHILTFNCWHGLDHTNPYLMSSMETPELKTSRIQKLTEVLQSWIDSRSGLRLVSLQELNPVFSLSKQIAQKTEMNVKYRGVNLGIHLGFLHFPPTLNEGLVNLWSKEGKLLSSTQKDLSGKAWGWEKTSITPLFLQFAERRGALFTLIRYQDKTILLANTHLHHELTPEGSSRRRQELEILVKHIKEQYAGADYVILAGDLNTGHQAQELEVLKENEFKHLKTETTSYTWDPIRNSIATKNMRLIDPSLSTAPEYQLQLDHIFVKTKKNNYKIKNVRLEFNETEKECSDHYALSAHLEI